MTIKSILPAWTPALIIPAVLIVALVIAGMLVLFSQDNEPPTPTAPAPSIASFSTAMPAITLGQIAQVSWQVSNADQVMLTVTGSGGTRQIELRPDESPYALTFDRTGAYTLTLQANRGEIATTATAMLQVLPQVSLSVETSEGGLIRHVESDVRLTWEVTGARAQEDARDQH